MLLFSGGGFLKLTENQIYNDLFLQFAKSNEGYIDPLSADVTGKNLLALGLEAIIFLSLNLIMEVILDENIPTSENNSNKILSMENVTKYYRTLTSKFKAVENLR